MQHLHRSVEQPFISFHQALTMTEISESCTADLPQGGKSLLFKDISKTVLIGSKVEKEILRNVSGTVLPGEMLALMGPSGSGKTSLLEILGGRSLTGVSGNVCLGGSLYQRKTMRHKVAYIMQDDIFMFSYVLTVRDHLTFAAQMKLSETLSNEQKTQKVVNVINDLGLNHCADSPLLLISGGERKRTSIGMEIISDPEILLIDEGTSGLDSTAAVSFIRLIKSIASRLSIPVVQAIHQPSTAVFYMFSAILLLSYGNVVYKGHPKSCMSYFLNLGYAPPHGASVNPADFALDLLHDDGSMESTLLDQTAICQHDGAPPRAILVENYKNIDPLSVLNEMEHQVSNTKDIKVKCDVDLNKIESIIKNISGRYPSYYSTQFLGLFSRSFRSARSSRFGFLNFAETIILALLVGACWFQTPSTENRLVDLTGYLFLSMLYWFFIGLFQGLLEFLPERVCLRKEREAGMYHLSAYFLAKTFASAPSRIILPSLYLLISYPMAVENPQASALFGVCAIVILVTLVGESLGLLVGTLTVKEDVAISVATLVALGMVRVI
jgi:ABC-type multidrug transport system ATPase subunit